MFFIFNTNPRFPPFLLYVRCNSGVTIIRRSCRDVNLIKICAATKNVALTLKELHTEEIHVLQYLCHYGVKMMQNVNKVEILRCPRIRMTEFNMLNVCVKTSSDRLKWIYEYMRSI